MAEFGTRKPLKDEVTDHTYFKRWTLLGPIIGFALGVIGGMLINSLLEGIIFGVSCGLFFGSSYGLRQDSKVHHQKHLGD